MSQNIRYFLPWLLLGFVLPLAAPLIVPLLPEENLSNWNLLYLLPVLGFGLWGLTWPYRKSKAGDLLFDAGRTWHSKMLFWVGIAESGVATFVTWLSLERMFASPDTADKVLQTPRVAFWWMIAILLISIGLSKLEIRERGICFLYTFLPWRRISAYRWETSRPSTLTIKVRRLGLLLSEHVSVRVPKRYRNEIEQIVNTYAHQ